MIMDYLSKKINDLLYGLTKIIIDLRISHDLDWDESQEIAEYILTEKRKITNEDHLNSFMENLKTKYSIFAKFIDDFKKQTSIQNEDAQKIDAIKNQLLKFT